MIAILDYGLGNLRSVQKAFENIGVEAKVVSCSSGLESAAKIVIPGVGAFGKGMNNILRQGVLDCLIEQILVKKKPVLGICLGMQLLAESSTEHGFSKGLGCVAGSVISLQEIASQQLIPNVGWCSVESSDPIMFRDVPNGSNFYFVHSFFYQTGQNADEVAGWTTYGSMFASALHKDNIWATQFHPEKSQKHGLQILKNFYELA